MADKEIVPFTPKESEFLCACIQYMRGTMDTDWDKVAELCKLKHGNSAKGTWNNIARKRGIGGGGSRNNKRKAGDDEDGRGVQENGGNGVDGAKPSKPANKRARAKKQKHDDGEESNAAVQVKPEE